MHVTNVGSRVRLRQEMCDVNRHVSCRNLVSSVFSTVLVFIFQWEIQTRDYSGIEFATSVGMKSSVFSIQRRVVREATYFHAGFLL
jgi:hypothetical protein